MIKKALKALYRYAMFLRNASPYARLSFGQEGEDIVLAKIFQFYKTGFYVDIGAHHPKRYSNTCFFYQKGWRGINIDPIPNMKAIFDKARPKDINIECGIGQKKGNMTFYIFSPGAYNTCCESKAKDVQNMGVKLLETRQIQVAPLADILERHLPEGIDIDFMNIDVEQLDFDVLQSNNWTKYRPKIIMIEMLQTNIEDCPNDPIYKFMKDQKYSLISKTVNTSFFKRNDFDLKEKPSL